MADLMAVDTFIQENILHSELWDYSDAIRRRKAVNGAEHSLLTYLPDIFKSAEEIPVDIIANQALWSLKVDDTLQRAEMGVQTVWVDGTMVTTKAKDLSIAPYVYQVLGIPVTKSGKRRRVGAYNTTVSGTFRIGNGYLAENRDIRRKVNGK
jgi:hypothetical protein